MRPSSSSSSSSNRSFSPSNAFEALESRQLMSAAAIPLGSVVSGKIAATAQTDTYQFTVPQGATINVASNATSIDTGYSAYFQVFDSDGARVDHWYGNNVRNYSNLTAGTYTVEVADSQGRDRGTYMLGVEGDSPISADAGALTAGGIISSSIDAPIDVKEFTFNVAEDGSNFQLNTNSQAIDTNYNTAFNLYDSTGAKLDTWFGNNSRTYQNMKAGTYMVKAADANLTRRGTFSIGQESLNQSFSPDRTLLDMGAVSAAQSIGNALETKEYSFYLTSDTKIAINTSSSAIDTNYNTQFQLFNSAGTTVDTWYGSNSRNYASLASGQYMIKANDANLARRGTFAIGVEALSGSFSPDAGKVAPGNVVGKKTSNGLDMTQYKFTLSEPSSTLEFNTLSTAIDANYNAHFQLFNSSGAVLDNWFGSSSRLESNLPAGNYMIASADANLLRRGSASIGVEFHSAPWSPDALSVANAKTQKVKIAGAMDVKQFVFAATNSKVTVTTSFAAIDRGFTPVFSLYDSSGTRVATWTGAVNSAVNGLKKNRTYMLEVQDGNLSRRGTFNLTLKNVKPSASLAPSVGAFSGLINGGGSFTIGVRLSASKVSSIFNDAKQVDFYKETNGKKGLQIGVGGDTLVGSDTRERADSNAGVFMATSFEDNDKAATFRYYAEPIGASDLFGPAVATDVKYTD